MTAAPKLQGNAPQLGDGPDSAPTGLLDQVVEMSDYLKQVSNPRALSNQKELAAAYDKAVSELVGPNDIQTAKKRDRDGNLRQFKKKSAWKKLARHFRIDVYEKSHNVVRTEDGNTIAEVTMLGVAPWGQRVEEIGACTTYEERFKYDKSKGWHDCLATAQTRASNRAISALIAAGEVSAEEAEGQQEREDRDDSSVATMPFGDFKGLPPTDGAVSLEALVYAIGWCGATDEKREKFAAFIDAAWKAVPEKIVATADDQLMKVHKWATTPKRADAWLALTKETGDAIHARGLDHEPKDGPATSEQRDQLLFLVAQTGYFTDAERKVFRSAAQSADTTSAAAAALVADGQKKIDDMVKADELAMGLGPESAEGNASAPSQPQLTGSLGASETKSSAPTTSAASAGSPTAPARANAVRRPDDNADIEQWRAYAKRLLEHPANAPLVPKMAGAIDTMPIHQLKNETGTLEAIVSGWNAKHKKQEQGRAGQAARKANDAAREPKPQPALTDAEQSFLDDGLDNMGNER